MSNPTKEENYTEPTQTAQETAQESTQEVAQETAQETAQESTETQAQTGTQEVVQETVQESTETQAQTGEKKQKAVYCFRCKQQINASDDHCPFCGFKRYVPMDEKKRDKIKMITTVVGIVVFIIIFVILEFKK